ncbi:MAG: substrate-binding periplasmic protein [Aeromonas veronii]
MHKTYWLVLILLQSWTVHAKAVLTVATDAWPPFRIVAPDGQLHGIDIAILSRLEQLSGVSLQIKQVPWGRALKQMETGQVDLMIGLAMSPARAHYIDYLQPSYYQCRTVFYGKAAAAKTLRTYEDLKGQTVGYVLNSVYFDPFDSDSEIHKYGVRNEALLLQMVKRDRLPLMIGGDCQVDYALSLINDSELQKAEYHSPQFMKLYLAMSKRSPNQAIKPLLVQALQQLIDSGEIATLAKPYQH